MIPQQIFKKEPCRKLQLKQNFHYISHSVRRISLLLRTLQSTIDTKKLYSGKIHFLLPLVQPQQYDHHVLVTQQQTMQHCVVTREQTAAAYCLQLVVLFPFLQENVS